MHTQTNEDSVAVEVNITELGNAYPTKIFVGELSAVSTSLPVEWVGNTHEKIDG